MLFRQSRFAWLTLLSLLVSFPLVAVCASLTGQRFRNDLVQWVDQDSPAAKRFADFRDQFGINEYVLITWQGCDLDDERLVAVESDLAKAELDPWVDRVSSGRTVYDALVRTTRLSEQVAKSRLAGCLIGADGKSTGVFLTLTHQGRADRVGAFAAIKSTVHQHVAADQIRWAGLGHDLHVLDYEGFHSPFRMLPWILLTAFLLTWLFVRSFSLALFINILGTYCGCLAFTFIYFTDCELNAIVWPLPTLMSLLTISASLHFLGYYRNALQLDDLKADAVSSEVASGRVVDHDAKRSVVQRAWSDAWRPTLYCSVTTAAGLFSLTFSHTQPVQQFGYFGSLSIVSCSLVTLLAMPAWLTLFPPSSQSPRSLQHTGADGQADHSSFLWTWIAKQTRHYRLTIIAFAVIVMAVVGVSIPKIRTGTDLQNFFPAGHRVLSDARAFEESVGPLSSAELLLTFQNPNPKNDINRIRLIGMLGRQIASETQVGLAVSAATFAPQWQPRRSGLQRVLENRKVQRLKEELVRLKLLDHEPAGSSGSTTETWRISLRYSSLDSVDVGNLTAHAKRLAEKVFLHQGQCVFQDEQAYVVLTGEFVLFDDLDKQFLTDLIVTYATAFVLVFVFVLVILRSIAGAVLAALPNLLPAMLVFGIAGLLEMSLDAASLMTASVALGIAVDDTLHLVIWWRNRQASGATAHESLINALSHCGMAVVQTSVICGFSIGMYAFCGFLPTVRFGILLLVMLMAALGGDLLLLPALLSTSLAEKSIDSEQ